MGLLKPRTATVPIYHGDDMERLGELRRAVDRAERAAQLAALGPRRGGDTIVNADAEKAAYDEFVDEAAERAVEVHLQAIGSKRFRALLAAHPARLNDKGEAVEDDAEMGVNSETFPLALLTFAEGDTRTITAPKASAEDLREFLEDEVSDGDFEELWVTAYWLNKAQGVDPRLGKYSTTTPTSSVS